MQMESHLLPAPHSFCGCSPESKNRKIGKPSLFSLQLQPAPRSDWRPMPSSRPTRLALKFRRSAHSSAGIDPRPVGARFGVAIATFAPRYRLKPSHSSSPSLADRILRSRWPAILVGRRALRTHAHQKDMLNARRMRVAARSISTGTPPARPDAVAARSVVPCRQPRRVAGHGCASERKPDRYDSQFAQLKPLHTAGDCLAWITNELCRSFREQ